MYGAYRVFHCCRDWKSCIFGLDTLAFIDTQLSYYWRNPLPSEVLDVLKTWAQHVSRRVGPADGCKQSTVEVLGVIDSRNIEHVISCEICLGSSPENQRLHPNSLPDFALTPIPAAHSAGHGFAQQSFFLGATAQTSLESSSRLFACPRFRARSEGLVSPSVNHAAVI